MFLYQVIQHIRQYQLRLPIRGKGSGANNFVAKCLLFLKQIFYDKIKLTDQPTKQFLLLSLKTRVLIWIPSKSSVAREFTEGALEGSGLERNPCKYSLSDIVWGHLFYNHCKIFLLKDTWQDKIPCTYPHNRNS